MTDRVHALTVVLDRDYRDDDVQAIVDAIKMIKGVVDVKSTITTPDDYMERVRVRHEILGKVIDAFKINN